MNTSIDDKIRIDNTTQTDFTLVDRNEFYETLKETFEKAEQVKLSLDGLSHGTINRKYFDKLSEMEEILSYKNQTESDKTKLYSKLFLVEKIRSLLD